MLIPQGSSLHALFISRLVEKHLGITSHAVASEGCLCLAILLLTANVAALP